MGMGTKVNIMVGTFIGILVLSILLIAFKGLVLGNAYEGELDTTYNDTGGTVHTIEGSSITGDTVAVFYGLLQGFVVLLGIISLVIEAVVLKKG